MERRGVSRREFNKWCLKMISLMGVATVTGGISNAQEIADKMAALKRPVVIWLQLQECTGCLESTIRSYNEGNRGHGCFPPFPCLMWNC